MRSAPFREVIDRLDRIELRGRIQMALARAAATAATRMIDPADPVTWEFSGFSQHGEDGIVDHLCDRMTSKHRFFFEIGAADGLENGTAWLAIARSYAGVMVEGNRALCETARRAYEACPSYNVHIVDSLVTLDRLPALLKMCSYRDPDVFSLDIDGIDYHIAAKIMELGFRPKVWVVEYNSAFGPDRPLTVPYRPDFIRRLAHESLFYYGASIAAWRKLFEAHSYHFITTETSGTNAFFVDPAAFPEGFTKSLQKVGFRENTTDGETRPYTDATGHAVLPPRDWQSQFPLIEGKALIEV
jgi:hypothetical protein